MKYLIILFVLVSGIFQQSLGQAKIRKMPPNINHTSINNFAPFIMLSYKTEYRAYSYQGKSQFDRLDNTRRDKEHQGFQFTERQFTIFQYIYQYYKHTRLGWDNNPELVNGKKFRQAVSDYWDPDKEGFNKDNSTRVDKFYDLIDRHKTGENNKDQLEETLEYIGAKLRPEEALFIWNSGSRMDRFIAHLDESDEAAVVDKLFARMRS